MHVLKARRGREQKVIALLFIRSEINEEISEILQMNSGIVSLENPGKLKLLFDRQRKFWAHETTTKVEKLMVAPYG